ncbi:MAG: 16S rRNA (guanine(966)-N(2))-methyltransferase RsmD [Cyanobacteria bacterium SIG30]|nr:16S rRNA (guanine(966)-N(2))-methyltransferase RsmD [Cyanobacteria bacterium SIG30]
MHLTAGLYKGSKVDVPKGVKPTLSKVRESVFNVLNSYFYDSDNLSFLDLFAGSGIMSLEAISRGYKVTSIELNRKNFQIIKSNFKSINAQADLICADCIKFLKSNTEKFDVIYIDPPWTNADFKYTYNDILELAFNNIKESGIIVFESEKIKKLLHQDLKFFEEKLIREKVYGRCLLSFYKA